MAYDRVTNGIPVVVLKAEHYGSLGIVRSLGRLGVPVSVVDSSKSAPAVFSRYCRNYFEWDFDSASESDTVNFLHAVAGMLGDRPMLIPTTDETTLLVDTHADTLRKRYSFPQQPPGLVQALSSKREQYFLAHKFGIPAPVSFFPNNLREVEEYGRTAKFPLLIKGIDGGKLEKAIGMKMMIARDIQTLRGLYERMEDPEKTNLMIQEYIQGNEGSVWLFNGYFDGNSECLAAFTGKKIRQNPVYTGMTSFGVVQTNDMIVEVSKMYMKLVGYRGIVDIDFCYDHRDGHYKILDVNPRVGATFRMFLDRNGVDVVRVMYFDLSGQPVPTPVPREGRKWIVEDKDLRSSFEYYKERKLTIGEWIRSLRGVEETGYFAKDDLRPFFAVWNGHLQRKIAGAQLPPPTTGAAEKPSVGKQGNGIEQATKKPFRGIRNDRAFNETKEAVKESGRAVVLAAGGSLNAYDLLRSLGMSGISSCVMSSQENDIMFSSQYCCEKVVLPSFDRHNYFRILNILIAYGVRCAEKPVLFYVSDPELDFVWQFRKGLEPYFRFLLPPEENFEALFSKVEFAKLANAQSIPAPVSLVCRSTEELEARVDEIPFPCIVKPAFSRHWNWETDELRARFGWYKNALRRFESREELIDFCRALPERSSGFVIQEYIDGRDDTIYSFHGYFNEQSNCLAHFVGRKIRTCPVHTGGSAYIRTIHRPDLATLGIDLLRKLRYRGIVKIDFKLDEATGRFKVLEINTRYSLWQLLGALAGINLAAVAYHHQSGGQFIVRQEYADDVRLLYFKRDLRALVTGYLRIGEWKFRSYIQSLQAKKHFFVWDPHDPLPFVFSSAGFVRRAFARVTRSLFPWINVRRERGMPRGNTSQRVGIPVKNEIARLGQLFGAVAILLMLVAATVFSQPAVVVDQLGYRPDDKKVAMLKDGRAKTFEVIDVQSNRPVLKDRIRPVGVNDVSTGDEVFVMDFSRLQKPGRYQLWIPDVQLTSPEFAVAEDVFAVVVQKTAESFYFQRCGTEVGKGTFWNHPPCHEHDAVLFESPSQQKDVTGGWHDAGDYGKFVATGALSAAFLLYAYEDRPYNFEDGQFAIPELNNGVPDILDEARWELQWLLKMQRSDGGVYHKTSTRKWTGEYLPHRDPDQRYIFQVSSTATGAFAAVAALGARHLDKWDKPFARELLKAAMNAWKFLQAHAETVPAGGFKNPKGVEGGEYGDVSDRDERLWASVELFRLTKNSEFHKYFLGTYRELRGFNYALGWQHVQNFGYSSYLRISPAMRNQEAAAYLESTLMTLGDELLRRADESAYRCVLRKEEYYWGSNSVALGYAHSLIQAAEHTKRPKYLDLALDQLHYILGRNTFGRVFVTGLGNNAVRNPYHQFSMMLGVGEPVPGLAVGGPNKNSRLRGRIISSYPGKCYEDYQKNYFVNEVAINYTAPLLYLASYLTETAEQPVAKQAPQLNQGK